MGGRGSGGARGRSGGGRLEGKSVIDVNITFDNVEKQLGLQELTASQKNTLVDMFRGMKENDRSYDANKTPYKISTLRITQPGLNDDVVRYKDVSVLVITDGNTGRFVDYMDRRTRQFIIGPKGGAYTYTDKGKRKNVRSFDVQYGSLR